MSFVCYFQCDRCGKRVDGDLTPPGWKFVGDLDICKACNRAYPEPDSLRDPSVTEAEIRRAVNTPDRQALAFMPPEKAAQWQPCSEPSCTWQVKPGDLDCVSGHTQTKEPTK